MRTCELCSREPGPFLNLKQVHEQILPGTAMRTLYDWNFRQRLTGFPSTYLLGNAAKATSKSGKVLVRACCVEEWVRTGGQVGALAERVRRLAASGDIPHRLAVVPKKPGRKPKLRIVGGGAA